MEWGPKSVDEVGAGFWAGSRDFNFFRRSAGVADPGAQADGFVLDGLAIDTWFASLDLPEGYPAEVQEVVAGLLVEAISPSSDNQSADDDREFNELRKSLVPFGVLPSSSATEEDEVAYIAVATESVPPHSAMLFMRSNIYIRLREMKRLKVSVVAGLLTNLVTHSAPIAVSATVALTLWENVKKLPDDEVELIHVMQRLTNNQAYTNWVVQTELVAALPTESRPLALPLLASLKTKGILEEAAGQWRAIR